MPYISIIDLNGKPKRHWIPKKLKSAELEAIKTFNDEQQHRYDRQRKSDSRHRDNHDIEHFLYYSEYLYGDIVQAINQGAHHAVVEDFSGTCDIWIVVREVLRSYPQIQRERLFMFLQGHNNSDIAKIQGCTPSAVEHSIRNILAQIRKRLS
ncbi:hypothetical protein [Ethanoligenens sp.]|uniref:hypothetical protein n=1 Tax=Ethanoligenens sp. TaxID=2099655 RepID=UPI0039EBC0A8